VLGDVLVSSTGTQDLLLSKQQITLLRAKEHEYKLQVGGQGVVSVGVARTRHLLCCSSNSSSSSGMWLVFVTAWLVHSSCSIGCTTACWLRRAAAAHKEQRTACPAEITVVLACSCSWSFPRPRQLFLRLFTCAGVLSAAGRPCAFPLPLAHQCVSAHQGTRLRAGAHQPLAPRVNRQNGDQPEG
jgi:hypothetical protein